MKMTTEQLKDFIEKSNESALLSLELSPEFLYWLATCQIFPPKGLMCMVRDIVIDAETHQVTFNIASQPQTVKKPSDPKLEDPE